MTRLPPFLHALAATTGVPFETLQVTARKLRDTGYLPASKRGVGAEHVGPASAANLLLATMVDCGPTEAVRALEVYRGLRPKRRGGFGQGFLPLHAVAEAPTFGEALTKLIEVGPRLKLEAMAVLSVLFDRMPLDQLLSLEFFTLEISVSKPVPFASMRLTALNEVGLPKTQWSNEWLVDSQRFMAGGYAPEMQAARADRRTETTITHKTIFKLADLIAAPDDTDDTDDTEITEENLYASAS